MRLEHLCEADPLQVMLFLISKFLFFLDTLSYFASVGSRVLKCSKIGHARRMGNFTREMNWTMNISANFCRTAKSFGWLESNLLRPLLNSPSLIAAEQHAYCSGGKINFWSHLGEERPKNIKNFTLLLPAVALNRGKRSLKVATDLRKLH